MRHHGDNRLKIGDLQAGGTVCAKFSREKISATNHFCMDR